MNKLAAIVLFAMAIAPCSPLARADSPPPGDLRRLLPVNNGSIVPPELAPGKVSVTIAGGTATFTRTGSDGIIQFEWVPIMNDMLRVGQMPLGQVYIIGNGDIIAAPVLRLTDSVSIVNDVVSKLVPITGGVEQVQTSTISGTTASVTTRITMAGKSLVIEVTCDKPIASSMDLRWNRPSTAKSIAIPYYSNPVTYFPTVKLFANAQLDWTVSNASTQHGYVAQYNALTDGTRNLLHERAVITASPVLDEVLPNIPNPPSPYRQDLAGRLVLDIWGDSFDSQRRGIESLADAGMMPAVALVHVWQHQGYDNGLPGHMPASDAQGGSAGMLALVKAGESRNCLMALHENYVDYYPDYEKFDENDIALNHDGSRMKAWFNKSTGIQSFAIKPSAIGPLSHEQSTLIHDAYGTNACYLDVHSAVPPGFHTDYRAGDPQAGRMKAVIDAHTKLWSFERTLHDGPVFGEGANHWYWSGLLDGVEAQPGAGWPNEQGMTMPLLVDFDLLKIHPLQINHGMGYYERWWGEKNLPGADLVTRLDQYRMQEVIFAHAPFLGASTWRNIPLAILESELVRPVSMREAESDPIDIDYLVDGKWAGSSDAAIAGQLSIVKVHYADGLSVAANSSDHPISGPGGVRIPQFGWYAEGDGMRGGTVLIGGTVADFTDAPYDFFANARAVSAWQKPGAAQVSAIIGNFTQTGPRKFSVTYYWRTEQKLQADYTVFVHFVRLPADPGNNEGIRFQQDHKPAMPVAQWPLGRDSIDGPYAITVPAGIADGDYEIYTGLYTHDDGRLDVANGDEHSRIHLGTLHVAGDSVSFTQVPIENFPATQSASQYARLNGDSTVLDFGPLRTNGCVRMHAAKTSWTLTPYPIGAPFTVELDSRRFGTPTSVRTTNPAATLPVTVGKDGWWTLPMNGAAAYCW